MIAVGGIVVRPEHRRKRLAAALVDVPQKVALAQIAIPALLDADPAAVGQLKRRHVELCLDGVYG